MYDVARLALLAAARDFSVFVCATSFYLGRSQNASHACCSVASSVSSHRAIPLFPVSQNKELIRGSGYIQFPPQRPFQGPVIVQPPTVSVRASALRSRRLAMRQGQLAFAKVVSCFAAQ